MTARSKAKGAGFERDVALALISAGHMVERVGFQAGMSEAYDLDVTIDGERLRGECKIRANGFRELYGWLTNSDALFIRADRKPALVVLPLETFLRITRHEEAS